MAEQPTDRELAYRVVSEGDEVAFRVLYRRHSPAVYRFLLRLAGGNVAEAEDLMQETWIKAAQGLSGFRWESAFRTWVTGIALNRFRELARRNGRRITEVDGDWEAVVTAADSESRIDLERALELLPPGFRTVLVLHDVQGLTHEEIGERLGITDGTSKSQLHRARKAMRGLMGVGLEMA